MKTVSEKMHCVWYDHFLFVVFLLWYLLQKKKRVSELKRERKRFWINEKEINIDILFFVMKKYKNKLISRLNIIRLVENILWKKKQKTQVFAFYFFRINDKLFLLT